MKIYDISQELFSSHVYPGDRAPSFHRVSEIAKGDSCNVTEVCMNAHNGTHVDAPCHFVPGGKSIESLCLETLLGPCTVKTFHKDVTAEDIESLHGVQRLLCKGNVCLTLEGAKKLAESSVRLIGVEVQSIAPVEDPVSVHVAVLSKGIVAVEGLVLDEVPDGEYFLLAVPIKLGGSDGAPCRALLLKQE